jgi:hypothetical protein
MLINKRFILCFSLLLLLLAMGRLEAANTVALNAGTTHSFQLTTGEYEIRYDPMADANHKGWLRITRQGHPGGIASKAAYGQHFDVLDAAAGEGDIYKWQHVRKDSQMFRRLETAETSATIEITIHTERRWAEFATRLIAYKAQPGLVRWTVRAQTRQTRAFSGKPSPECFFIAPNGSISEWGDQAQEVVRYSQQRGPTLPHVFFRSVPLNSYVFYFEDLSSLNDLYRLTNAAVPYDYPINGNQGAVGMGEARGYFQHASADGKNIQPMKPWRETVERFSEFGYRRPENYRVPAGTSLVVADTYLYLRPATATDNTTICKNFVTMLGDIFQYIYKPPVIKTDWSGRVVPRMLHDILRPENTGTLNGKFKLPRAYVGYEHEDNQLWTLLNLLHPLELYVRQFPQQSDARELYNRMNSALPAFFDKQWGGFHNTAAPLDLDQFFTPVYIFSQAVMVADLALLGNENARMMLTGFRDRLLAMGKAFDYVMADIWLRDFSKQRGYYQADSTSSYLYVMMALYELSGHKDAAALAAARGAAAKMSERCQDLMWEANMTAAGIVGAEWLYRATKDPKIRDLAYIPLANVLRESWLWECDFGMGEKITTFWSISGCPAAPSSAEFEAHRVRLHFKQYNELAGDFMPAPVRAMLADAWQRGPTQSRFSLAPLMVEAGAQAFMAAEGHSETNCGYIDYAQMIPFEDVRAGWGTDLEWWQNNSKAGVVGQEIYGAGGPIWYALWQQEATAHAAESKGKSE